jgi:hypothetical protein
MQAHTNRFIVLCNSVESDFMACARQSDSEPVHPRHLDAWLSRQVRRHCDIAAARWPGAVTRAARALNRSVLMHWQATSWQGWGVLRVQRQTCDTLGQRPGKKYTYTIFLPVIARTLVAKWLRQLVSMHTVIGSNPAIIQFFYFVKNVYKCVWSCRYHV